MTNLCVGCAVNCCRCFTLRHVDPNYLKRLVKDRNHADATFALKHFTYLGFFSEHPMYPTRGNGGYQQHFYKCNLVTEDGLCSDYENRPDVCKEYGGDYAPDLDCPRYPEWLAQHKDEHEILLKTDDERQK